MPQHNPYSSGHYMPPQRADWYHFSGGDHTPAPSGGAIAVDFAMWMGMESFANAYAGGESKLFAPAAKGFWTAGGLRSFMGGLVQPMSVDRGLATMMSVGIGGKNVGGVSQYYGQGSYAGRVNPFNVLKSASAGSGIFFKSGAGSTHSRLVDVLGRRAASRISSSAMLTMGVRTAFTAFNLELGLSLGRGLGDMIASYEESAVSRPELETGGIFADTRASFTQRQRAIQVIHNSQLTTRAALGNEATFMHY